MSWLKTVLGIATVGVAAAAVLVKVNDDKKKQQELDEFLCPDEDGKVLVLKEEDKELPYEQVEKDVIALSKNDATQVTCYFTFEYEDEEKAKASQEEFSDSGISTSLVKNVVDVMYSGTTILDDVTDFFMKLYPILEETKPNYQGYHFEG